MKFGAIVGNDRDSICNLFSKFFQSVYLQPENELLNDRCPDVEMEQSDDVVDDNMFSL